MQVLLLVKLSKKNYLLDNLKTLLNFFKTKKNTQSKRDTNVLSLENSIIEKIGLKVQIKNKSNNKGSIVIEYKDLDQLNKIIEIIKSNY